MTQEVKTASTTWVAPAGVTSFDVLVVGGGGGGGGNTGGTTSGGGGGGGGVSWQTGLACTPGGTYDVTVGAGGAASSNSQGGDGGGSSMEHDDGAIVVAGGGGGGDGNQSSGSGLRNGRGGANGGGGGSTSSPAGTGGTATIGNNGGAGFATATTTARGAGGGGGMGGLGGAGGAGSGGVGGGGLGGTGSNQAANVGTSVGAAGIFGGGGGGGYTGSTTTFPGGGTGTGGGGNGGRNNVGTTAPTAGAANTGGGGGGGAQNQNGAAGGSGVVIIQYTIAAPGVPTSVAVTGSTETSLELSWSAPASGGSVTGYEVRIDGGTPVSATSPHNFTGLTAGTSYDLEVRAVGPGGNSSWVLVTASTDAPTPPGYYRITLELGAHSWTIEHGDAAAYGPTLPVNLGWSIPDAVEFFPAPADTTTLSFRVIVQDASELADVARGETVTFRMYVSADPDAEPWQSFDGIVTQLEGETRLRAAGDPDVYDFIATVYCADDTMRLADMYVGYAGGDWPIESQADRADRICTEAGLTFARGIGGGPHGLGAQGWLAARTEGQPISVLEALKAAIKDSADDYDSEPPFEFYGRYVLQYVPADDTVYMHVFRRRVFDTTTLDGGLVHAEAFWTKQPGPAAASWNIIDGLVTGTPSGVPYVRGTNMIDYFGPGGLDPNYSAQERDNLGESLLPDGSTVLDGWSSRTLTYEASLDPDPVTMWASYAPPTVPQPVVVTPISAELELNTVDYVAGTLTGARLVIPPGGKFYLELRLRAELLEGTDLP